MMPERIILHKSIEERLEEYQLLLENVDTPCSEIIEIWATIFEELTIIGTEWRALWILSEKDCQNYDMLFPSAVIVLVNDFTWKDLTANVSVIAVQEEVALPQVVNVAITELYPIKDQDYDDISIRIIEDWLDKCRYFFKNLWYPWDAKLNVTIGEWCDSHLKNRLIMQNDMKNGTFDKTTVNYLKSLLCEAQGINSLSDKSLGENKDNETLFLVKQFLRRKAIKTELDLFEDPVLRYGMVSLKREEKHLTELFENPEKQQAKFVWKTGNCDSLINNLKIAKSLVDSSVSFKVCESLQEALDRSLKNNIILLPTGVYAASSLQGLENGGSIKGLPKSEAIIMPDLSALPKVVLLSCFGPVELENLTITKPTGIVIQIFDGTLKIMNCKIVSKPDVFSKGIVVTSRCKVNIEKCEIKGFGTGLVLHEGSCLSISNSKIIECGEGIKVRDNVCLTMCNVEVSSCSKFGIQMETIQLDSDRSNIGNLSLLEKIDGNSKFNFHSVMFKNNLKGNVVVRKCENFVDLETSYGDNNSSNEVICLGDELCVQKCKNDEMIDFK